jgi:hypothetical protein
VIRTTSILLCVLVMTLATANAAIYVVRPDGTGDYPTIQSAIDASAPGDTVCLDTGVFTGDGNKNLDTQGKTIVITSLEGPDSSIIDCQRAGRAFHIHTGEGPTTVIERIQVMNGDVVASAEPGGALLCEGASPTIRDNIFYYNWSEEGGAIAVSGCASTIVRNLFVDNCCTWECEPFPAPPTSNDHAPTAGEEVYGSGIWARSSSLAIVGNEFLGNTGLYGALGSAVYIDSSTVSFVGNQLARNGAVMVTEGTVVFVNSVVSATANRMHSNVGDLGGGIRLSHSTGEVRANTFISNMGTIDGGGVEVYDQSDADVRFNLFDLNAGGSVDVETSQARVERNIIARTHRADMSVGHGVESFSSIVHIRQNTFYHNLGYSSAPSLGHDIYYRGTMPTMERNLFVSPEAGDLINCGRWGAAARSANETVPDYYNMFWEIPKPDDWSGPWPPDFWGYACLVGFFIDPLLCDPENGNYFPAEGSPCQADSLPWDMYNGGELFGALPVGCDLSEMLSVYVPPNASDTSPVAGELYMLGDAWLTNVSNVPTTIVYRVEVDAPYQISDNGDPLALVGATPVLPPGGGWSPPNAAIVTPDVEGAEHVSVHYIASYAPALTMWDTATTTVTFGGPVAVALHSFTGVEAAGAVVLEWETAEGLSPDGWQVYRSGVGAPVLLTHPPLDASARSFEDGSVELGRSYTYTLASLEDDGERVVGRVSVTTTAPELSLSQNVPNPFNPATTIRFSLDRAERATLVVYTVEGKTVATLADQRLGAGPHAVAWDGTDGGGRRVASGVYLYRLRAGSRSLVRKMVLLR